MREFEAGPPMQNSVCSPKPWRTVSWDITCACAPHSLISADNSSSAKTSSRATAPSPVAALRPTTSRHSEWSGSPKKRCLRRSPRRHRQVRPNQPSDVVTPAASTPSTISRRLSFMGRKRSGAGAPLFGT